MTLKLLFIPGMMCNHRLFEPVMDLLPSHMPVQVCDIPSVPSIEGMAKQIGDQLKGEYILVGLSLGGIIALEMYRYFAPHIKGLVLLNTTANADNPINRPVRERQIIEVLSGNLFSVVRDELKPNYLAEQNSHKRELKQVVMEMALEIGETAFRYQSMALMDRKSSWDILADLSCNAFFACGEEDKLCPPALHDKMGGCVKGSQVIVYPGSGHLLSLEVPKLITDDILQFYEQCKI